MSAPADSPRRPSRSQLRGQAAIDSAAALVLAMLAWPFPLARALLPVAVNVASVIVFWQLVQVAYCALAAGVWGKTGGMRLLGLSLRATSGGDATRGQRSWWGALNGAGCLVRAVVPPTGETLMPSERISGVELFVSEHQGDD